ncbi:hypothetical protein GCM10022267_85420 [Lentzea roselyniae]|uniref:Uncharacterized protein n=1 Tax=Lentzea roselyniae TaxID=531940 RepID=A0ABP7CAM5_9PSEU
MGLDTSLGETGPPRSPQIVGNTVPGDTNRCSRNQTGRPSGTSATRTWRCHSILGITVCDRSEVQADAVGGCLVPRPLPGVAPSEVTVSAATVSAGRITISAYITHGPSPATPQTPVRWFTPTPTAPPTTWLS